MQCRCSTVILTEQVSTGLRGYWIRGRKLETLTSCPTRAVGGDTVTQARLWRAIRGRCVLTSMNSLVQYGGYTD